MERILLEMTASGRIFRPTEIRNMMRYSDLVISRRRYVHICQFGLVTFSDNQTGFLKFMNVVSSLFSVPDVALVLITGIQDVSLLLTSTLVLVTTTSFHITFELFNRISSPFFRQIVSNHFPCFSTCHHFQHAP